MNEPDQKPKIPRLILSYFLVLFLFGCDYSSGQWGIKKFINEDDPDGLISVFGDEVSPDIEEATEFIALIRSRFGEFDFEMGTEYQFDSQDFLVGEIGEFDYSDQDRRLNRYVIENNADRLGLMIVQFCREGEWEVCAIQIRMAP